MAVCSQTADIQQSINQHRRTSPACCCHTLDIKLLHLGRAVQRRPERCACHRWWLTVTENGKIAFCSTCFSKRRRVGRKCMSFNTTYLSPHLKSCGHNQNVSCWLSCQPQEAGNYRISCIPNFFWHRHWNKQHDFWFDSQTLNANKSWQQMTHYKLQVCGFPRHGHKGYTVHIIATKWETNSQCSSVSLSLSLHISYLSFNVQNTTNGYGSSRSIPAWGGASGCCHYPVCAGVKKFQAQK